MLYDTMLMFCLLGVVPLLAILIFVVIYRKKGDTKTVPPVNKQKAECKDTLDKELREFFVSEYIDSSDCMYVKLQSLPKSFKIGSVYFNKTETIVDRFRGIEAKEVSILSYVEINGKVFDNGFTQYYTSTNCNVWRIENQDLLEYILDNLDKVEEIKQ